MENVVFAVLGLSMSTSKYGNSNVAAGSGEILAA
jgi:hypothetical protein